MSEAERRGAVISFGTFEVDLDSGELRRQGIKVKIQELPFRFLVLLLEEPGAVVTRDELREKLWSPETFVDFDHGINTAANKLREALGDTADNPVFIETLPRRGYRFLAPVQRLSAERPAATAGARRDRRRAGLLLAAAGAVFSMFALAYYSADRFAAEATDDTIGRARLVVLPLSDYTQLPDGEIVADGLTEEVTARLGRLSPQRLGVIGRTSAMTYKNTAKGIDEIGTELGVDYVLEGSIRAEGARRNITVQLIAVTDQTSLWAHTYDYDGADVLGLQNDVAKNVASALTLEILQPLANDAAPESQFDPRSYEAYLRGRFFRAQLTASGYRRSIEHFKNAIQQAPEFAPAHAGLAGCFCLLAGHGIETLSVPEAMSQARDAASTALEIDPDSPEAHAVMGMVKMKYEWDGEAAEEHFQRAIEINPSYSQAHLWYSIYLTAVERHDEAVIAARRARALDALSLPANVNLAQQLYEARRYDEAVDHLTSALELAPDSWGMYWGLGESYRALGRQDEALEALERAFGLAGGANSLVISALGYTYAVAGRERDARTQLDRLLEAAEEDYVSPAHIAAIHAGLGDADEVFRWLERAYEVRSRSLIWLRVAHEYENLRADPRFQDLVARVGL